MGGIRIDATTKYLTRTSSPLNHNVPYTWCTWFETTTSNDKKCNLMVLDRGTFTDMDRARPFWFEAPLDIEVSGNLTSGTINLTLGRKWFIAIVRRSTTLLEGYVDCVLDVSNTTDVSGRGTATRMSMGALPEGSEGTDNCILYPSIAWQAALTIDELRRQMQSITPVRRAHLFGFWPMLPGTGNRGRDLSGNGKHWTETGSLTDAIGPGVAWEPAHIAVMLGAASAPPDRLSPTTVIQPPQPFAFMEV